MRMSWSGHREVRKVGIMATRSSSSPPEQEPHNTPSTAEDSPPAVVAARFTRARAVWAATGVALLLLILLIVFMLQNSTKVDVHFLGMSGSIPLGMAVLIAAVGGGELGHVRTPCAVPQPCHPTAPRSRTIRR